MKLSTMPLELFVKDNIEPFPEAGFTYEDDKWDLHKWNTVATKKSSSILNFESLVSWLKPSVKAFISYGWLAQDLSIGWMKAYLISFRKLSDYLVNHCPYINQISKLNQEFAEGFAEYLNEKFSNQVAYKSARDVMLPNVKTRFFEK